MSALGIVFSNIHNETIDELTRKRTSASIPFGARYRLIDFVLSNFINAEIQNVGILAQKNYQSLMDHVGSGREWDLARKNGGLIIFPPYSSHRSDFLYENRFEALQSISGYIDKNRDDYVVLTDCDSVNLIDYTEVLDRHQKSGADITVVYKKCVVPSDLVNHMSLNMDENGRVVSAQLHSKLNSESSTALNVFVINRSLLCGLLSDSMSSGIKSLTRDVVLGNVKSLKIFGYQYDGIYLHMNSMENFFKGNMALLKDDLRIELFGDQNRTIITKVRDSAPTRYGDNAVVKNSFVADGCEIEGYVENCIIFRGVKIAAGTVVKNSIIMQDTQIAAKCNIDHVVTDKNVTIRERNNLMGCAKVPYYLGKYSVV